MKFISGEANVVDWEINDKDVGENMGTGKYGSCCSCQGREPPSTTTTITPLTTTTTATTTTSGSCKSWCGGHTAPWQKKCEWGMCSGCSQCNARRLRGNII